MYDYQTVPYPTQIPALGTIGRGNYVLRKAELIGNTTVPVPIAVFNDEAIISEVRNDLNAYAALKASQTTIQRNVATPNVAPAPSKAMKGTSAEQLRDLVLARLDEIAKKLPPDSQVLSTISNIKNEIQTITLASPQ